MNLDNLINELMVKHPKARRIAVSNFVSSVDLKAPVMETNLNLEADAACYCWNQSTVMAIREGVQARREASSTRGN